MGPQSELHNGQLFYQTANGWESFDDLSQINIARDQPVNIVYVIKEAFRENDRSGVLVIKSGTMAPDPAEPPKSDRVQLIRGPNEKDLSCGPTSGFGRAYVSGKGYEDYHAYMRRETKELKTERTVIERFHIKYKRRNECIATNDTSGDRANNASQFSFDTTVTDEGVPRGLWYSIFGGTIYKGPAPYAARRTEIKYYRLSEGMQCVRFVVKVAAGARSFLRVNDLEGREAPPSTRRLRETRLGN